MNDKRQQPQPNVRLRAILLATEKRPEVLAEAKRLQGEIQSHAEIVRTALTGDEDISDVEADLALVLGGDGSILRAARQMRHRQLPVVAINMGKLGFLANISAHELPALLSDYRAGLLHIAEHLMFECSLIQDGAVRQRQLGLNEVAVLAGTPFSIINVNLYVDSE